MWTENAVGSDCLKRSDALTKDMITPQIMVARKKTFKPGQVKPFVFNSILQKLLTELISHVITPTIRDKTMKEYPVPSRY